VLESVGIFQQTVEAMDCQRRVLDVFVTNADPNQEDDYDDQFVCPVQSVRLHENYAVIVEDETDWVTPLFPFDATSDPFKEIMKGDLIRVGVPSTGGFTDYLTVVEKVPIKAFRNATSYYIATSSSALDYGGEVAGTMNIDPYEEYHVYPSSDEWLRPHGYGENTSEHTVYNAVFEGGAGLTLADDTAEYEPPVQLYALRLNHSINATTINEPIDANRSKRIVAAVTTDAQETLIATLENRQNVTMWGGGHLYPMYHMKEWRTGQSLTAELDHGVKQVEEVRLMGYSLMNKRNVGPQHAHEMIQDDYLILRIKEVEGKVISNNRHANGAFAILYAGSHADNTKGGVDVHKYDTDGIVVRRVDATNSVMRNLTVELLDRTGKPAHFGRLHLWFKILATHG
jgi:hypothetical protein